MTPDGKPCIVAVPLGNRSVLVSVWRVRLGRVKLSCSTRTSKRTRPGIANCRHDYAAAIARPACKQEIILGIGGVRALKAMGSQPAAWHLNEGHAAFVVLQRIRDRSSTVSHSTPRSRKSGARRSSRRTRRCRRVTTPFHFISWKPTWRMRGERWAHTVTPSWRSGTTTTAAGLLFSMTALALRTAGATNAVSRVHREVTRDMWGPIWPGVTEEHRPVRAITNGIHVPTWLSAEMTRLLDDHLDAGWRDRHDDPALWNRILEISDEDLWGARQALRNYLFAFIRERARSRWKEEHVTAARVVAAGTLLDPNALTIGFARRFTGYKRSELIFRNPDRLLGILNAARRPVQSSLPAKHTLQMKPEASPAAGVARDRPDAGRVAFVG
jgi:starch phosphorylase